MGSIIPSTSTTLSMKEKLQLLMKTKTEVSHEEPTLIQKKIKNLNHVIKKDFTYFQEDKVRGKYIQMAYDLLMTIRLSILF